MCMYLRNKSMVIYLITNTLNGKQYVGQTQRTLLHRMKQHLKEHLYIDRVIRKYGIENFTFKVLEECATIDELNEQERFWIATLNTKKPNGYNLTDGGEGVPGMSHTKESCKKISKTMKKLCEIPSIHSRLVALAQENASNPLKRARLSTKLKEIYKDPELRALISCLVKKAFEDPEVRRRHSEGLKRYYANHPEAIIQKSETTKRIHSDPAMRAKISERTKAALADPEKRKKIAEGTKRALADPAVRKKMSEAQKKRQAREREEREKKRQEAELQLNFEQETKE